VLEDEAGKDKKPISKDQMDKIPALKNTIKLFENYKNMQI
jgi:hypothetical protein